MVEPIMYGAIGFLIAGLLVIGFIPLVHARAERLTTRRLEALTPLSMAEIQAEKDQLRAEFAMSTRRLEMSVEQLKAKTTNQLTEIGRKSDAIGRLKLDLGEKTASLFALEAKEKQLSSELHAAQAEIATKERALAEAERALATMRAEFSLVSVDQRESAATAESRRVELLALRAQAEALKGQIESYDKETQELEAPPQNHGSRQVERTARGGARQSGALRRTRDRARPCASRLQD
jgi:chromosome segregation ATPase